MVSPAQPSPRAFDPQSKGHSILDNREIILMSTKTTYLLKTKQNNANKQPIYMVDI